MRDYAQDMMDLVDAVQLDDLAAASHRVTEILQPYFGVDSARDVQRLVAGLADLIVSAADAMASATDMTRAEILTKLRRVVMEQALLMDAATGD